MFPAILKWKVSIRIPLFNTNDIDFVGLNYILGQTVIISKHCEIHRNQVPEDVITFRASNEARIGGCRTLFLINELWHSLFTNLNNKSMVRMNNITEILHPVIISIYSRCQLKYIKWARLFLSKIETKNWHNVIASLTNEYKPDPYTLPKFCYSTPQSPIPLTSVSCAITPIFSRQPGILAIQPFYTEVSV